MSHTFDLMSNLSYTLSLITSTPWHWSGTLFWVFHILMCIDTKLNWPSMSYYTREYVKTNNSVKHYIGATEGTKKQRIYNHNLPFTNRNYSSNTSLSSHIWYLKDINISPTITWEILKLVPSYNKTLKKKPPSPPQKISHHHKTPC